MRKGVVVCGANGERGVFMEKAMERFSKWNLANGKSLQFSVCTVGLSPIMMSMSGVEIDKLTAVNGCRNKCCDRIMERNGMKIATSVILDDCTEKNLGPCEYASVFDFPEPSDEELERFVEAIKKAIG
ncbi:MAG TPA: putative zinc-binding protein [Methanomassiliicoccales archaeon]|jgi:uncharacterized metal-binding protein